MNEQDRRRKDARFVRAIRTTAAAAVVVLAAFLPWFRIEPEGLFPGGWVRPNEQTAFEERALDTEESPFLIDELPGIWANGWRGRLWWERTVEVDGQTRERYRIVAPLWAGVPIALLLALIAWVEWKRCRDFPLWAVLPVAAFGLLYSLFVIHGIVYRLPARIGPGGPVTALAFAFLVWFRLRRAPPSSRRAAASEGPLGEGAAPSS